MATITYAVWAFAAGALVPMMAALMAGLARESGGAIQALVLMFATGLIASLLLAAIADAHIPTIRTLVHIAPHRYAGGLIVGFYILSITFLAPRFGVGNAILFAFTAQLITAAFIDHFALAGAALRPLTTMRASGLFIVVAGVIITQVGDRMAAGARNSHAGEEIRYMSAMTSTPIGAEAKPAPTPSRLFFLDLSAGRILSANTDGSDLKTLINEGRKRPDGLALDVAAGHIYWTNMGDPKRNDGSILRSDLNGKNMITIVPPGGTFTPKQLKLEKGSAKLYWSDREGMRVMRANLDGSGIETLVDTSQGDSRPGPDQRKWCVGIAVDTDGGKFYWTQKGGDSAGLGRIFRANIQVPPGQSAENRSDVELLYDNLPEPIDLDLDPVHRTLYWTDRGDPPRGNTVNRAPMDPEAGNGGEPEILFTHLVEGIGVALDLKGGRMFITDFGGSVYSANLDGSNRRTLLEAEGNLTGIAYAEVPSRC